MRNRTVIFDMDGVLVDTEMLYLNGFLKTLQDYGYACSREMLLPLAGKGLEEKLQFAKETLGFEVPAEEAAAYYRQVRFLPDDYIPYKMNGLDETLRKLREMGCRMAVASNSKTSHINRILESCGIKDYFTCVSSGTELGKRKPDPAVYLHILETMKSSQECCLAVEDSDVGIQAAKSAGIRIAARKDERFGFSRERPTGGWNS